MKVNWNRTSAHQIWAKYSMMDASVQDLFYLPFTEAGGGDTQVYLGTVGTTWTLSPTLIVDGNAGFNVMTHQSQGPDYGTNYGSDLFGIPGTNAQGVTGNSAENPERHSGMPVFNTGLGVLGNNSAVDARVARRAELHGVNQPDQGGGPPRRSGRASTSSACS